MKNALLINSSSGYFKTLIWTLPKNYGFKNSYSGLKRTNKKSSEIIRASFETIFYNFLQNHSCSNRLVGCFVDKNYASGFPVFLI